MYMEVKSVKCAKRGTDNMKTILVVDDDKHNLKAVRKVLSEEYRVILVVDGQQALNYLENGECNIILLDIYMPKMDGFEVLKKIRGMEHCRNIPVIFLTGDNDAETETRCFKEGAADYITKPFVSDIMLARIGRTFELEELRRDLEERLAQTTREISEMRKKARQDALTGLWNRMHIEEAVNDMLTQGTAGALMMIDMDNFKFINDHYGHIVGDRVLIMLADTLRDFTSEDDILCRIGGDEFMVFVKDVTLKCALSDLAANIISDLRKKINECGFEVDTSVSIGIAQAPEDGNEFIVLYNAADKALYHVKQNGKSACHFFSDRLQAENARSEKIVDLEYLQDLMNRTDSDVGAYLMEFESFHHVYHFIRRFAGRNNRDVQIVLFTITENENVQPDTEETELALDLLEKAVYTFLRRSDVSTRYSSKQLIVILMDTDNENGDMVAERIVEIFNMVYMGEKVRVDYGIARMDGKKVQ